MIPPAVLMLLAAACTPAPEATCEAAAPDGWVPEVEEAPISVVWDAPTPCAGCLEVSGEATGTFAANRHIVHRLRGVASGEALLDVLGEQTVVDGPFDIAFTPSFDEPAAALVVRGTASLAEVSLTREDWVEVEGAGEDTLNLGFLVHVETNNSYLTDERVWSRDGRVIRALADVFAERGAVLTLQADETFNRGMAIWDPDLAAHPGLDWSIHIHPADDGSDFAQVTREGKAAIGAMGARVLDLNGGFGLGDWEAAARLGLRTLSAFKDAETQRGLPLDTTRPWRASADASNADPEAFMQPDPAGPLLYLPGSSTQEIDHRRFPEHARRVTSQALARTAAGAYDTWYFVLHVDDFGAKDPEEMDAWLDAELEATAAWYGEALDGLGGDLRFVGVTEMGEAALDGECPPRSP